MIDYEYTESEIKARDVLSAWTIVTAVALAFLLA